MAVPPPAVHVLVNVDCDNVIGEDFIEQVAEGFRVDQAGHTLTHVMAWRGHEAATTGRLAYTEEAFKYLRGYDEEGVYGSGYQDVDLLRRAEKAPGLTATISRGRRSTLEDSRRMIGFPLPNSDSGNIRYDINVAKVCNCYNPKNLTWGKMNEFNQRVMAGRLAEGKIQRNLGRASIGYPFNFLEVTALHFEFKLLCLLSSRTRCVNQIGRTEIICSALCFTVSRPLYPEFCRCPTLCVDGGSAPHNTL